MGDFADKARHMFEAIITFWVIFMMVATLVGWFGHNLWLQAKQRRARRLRTQQQFVVAAAVAWSLMVLAGLMAACGCIVPFMKHW